MRDTPRDTEVTKYTSFISLSPSSFDFLANLIWKGMGRYFELELLRANYSSDRGLLCGRVSPCILEVHHSRSICGYWIDSWS